MSSGGDREGEDSTTGGAGSHDHGPKPGSDFDGDRGNDASDGRREDAGEANAVVEFRVPEMDCPSCAGKVERSVRRLEGIGTVDPQITTGTLTVGFDPGSTTASAIADRVEKAGYEVTGTADGNGTGDGAFDREGSVWTSRRAVKTWIGAVVVGVGLLLEFGPARNAEVGTLFGSPVFVADLLFLFGVAVAGQAILRNGYYSARNLNLDIDFLMSVAVLGALIASVGFGERFYFEAATLAVLFSVAELLEQRAMDRARTSLRELMDLSPTEATVERDGETITVPVEDVGVGDTVIVRPGERIPVDGEVSDGESAVNQAPVTGEGVPVEKSPGDPVYAGTINESGYLEVRTTAAPGADTLSRIVELVEAAQSKRTDRERFVDRFSAYYTPAVVGFAIIVTLGSPFLLGTAWSTAVIHGLTLLVLACPCAFMISTPVSVVSGLTSAAKNGVLVKAGESLEAVGDMDVVAFDKTGTLTKGELAVTDVIPLNDNTESDVLRCARGLEQRSEHPIGEAIVARADGRSVPGRDVEAFESLAGKGVRAELDGTPHFAGKPDLFEELGFDLSHVHATTDGGVVTRTARELCDRNNCLDLLEDTVPELQAEGKTVVLVGTEDELEGIIAVADGVRPEAARAIRRLRELGVEKTVMLTGDNRRVAEAVGRDLGVDEIRAELLPEEKVAAVESLTEAHDGVAMVGDGINDAPALASATVGVAMGAAGTDTALETADIALLGDDLSRLPYLRELGVATAGVIRQNIVASLGVKAALAVAVPFGYVPIWLAVLAGDAGMTTAVTGNAMRLAGITPDGTDPDAERAGT